MTLICHAHMNTIQANAIAPGYHYDSVRAVGGEAMEISDLKQFVDQTVTLQMTDGELAKVRVHSISEEYNDIIVDVLQSTRSQPYNPACAYTFAAADIVLVAPST